MTRRIALLTILCTLAMASTSLAVTIPNGSFEDGANDTWVNSIADWTLLPPVSNATPYRAGLFFDFDGYTAQAANAFAVFTHRGIGDQSAYSQQVFLGPDDDILSFDYVYVTKNAPGDTTHVDPFTVTLWSSSVAQQTWTVSGSGDTNLASGSISTLPFQPNGNLVQTYDTGWQHHEISIKPYVGQTVYLEFRIGDSAQGGGTAGIFLDTVAVTPEPGTFLLFGIGALGLTLYGRRRRLSRKK